MTEVEVDELEDDEGDDLEVHESREGVALSHVALYVELMGRHSNLILVDDDGRIMESAKRVPPEMSRVRPVLPRLPYAPPPPDRLDPRSITPAATARPRNVAAGCRACARAGQHLSRHQSGHGHEIVFQATGSSETRAGDVNAEARSR